MMDNQAHVEEGTRKKSSIFKPDIPVIFMTTAIVMVALAVILPFWWKYDPIVKFATDFYSLREVSKEKVFTKDELAKYSAKKTKEKLYVAILGKVFDVTVGQQHYGKEGSYSFFTGIDGTRAFVTGDFNKNGLTDNIDGLSDEECLSISDWEKFFANEYTYVGKVVGNFYNLNGEETNVLKEFSGKLKSAQKEKEKDESDKQRFPECNSRWTKEEGTTVWCTNESGGVKRDWIGLPRMFYKPGQSDYRCACVHDKDIRDSRLKHFDGCRISEVSCKVKS